MPTGTTTHLKLSSAMRAAIVLAWIALFGIHVARTEGWLFASTPQGVELTRSTMRLDEPEREEWFIIYSRDEPIGYARHRQIPLVEGYVFEDHSTLRLSMMGVPREIRTSTRAQTSPTLELQSFSFRLRSGSIDFLVNGRAKGDRLEVDLVSSASKQRTIAIPLDEPLVLPQFMNALLGRGGLETGASFHYTIIDPATVQPATVQLTIGELETIETPLGAVEAFRVRREFRGSEQTLWLTPEGRTVREQSGLGLTLVRADRESALAARSGSGAAFDVTSASAIPLTGQLDHPRELEALRIRLTGVPQGRTLDFPPRQVLENGVLSIRSTTGATPAPRIPVRDPALAAALATTPFVQSDAPEIVELARQIVGDTDDSREAASRILDWVFRTIAKSPSFTVPTALDVLAAREGDCNEHAVLFAALARAAGIPTRIAAGAVYMPGDSLVAGAFYYHAWAEVWLGEWTAVDPVFGQFPADATHVKLLEGGPETHGELLSMLGKLAIAVEES